MTAISRDKAQIQLEGGGIELRTQEIGGAMTVAFIRAPQAGTWGQCWSASLTTSASVRTGDTC